MKTSRIAVAGFIALLITAGVAPSVQAYPYGGGWGGGDAVAVGAGMERVFPTEWGGRCSDWERPQPLLLPPPM